MGNKLIINKIRDHSVPELSQFVFPSDVNVSQVFLNAQKKLDTDQTILLLLRHSSVENAIVRCYRDEGAQNSKIISRRICRANGSWVEEEHGNTSKEDIKQHFKKPVTGRFLDFVWPQKEGCQVVLIDNKEGFVKIDDLFRRTLTYVTIGAGSTLWKGVPEKIPMVGSMIHGQFELVTPDVMWKRTSQFPRVQWFTPDVNVAETFAQLYKTDRTKAYVAEFKVNKDIKLLNLDLAAIKYLGRVDPQIRRELEITFPVKRNHVQRYSTHQNDLPLFEEMCKLSSKHIADGLFSDRKFLSKQKLPTKSIVPQSILARELALCDAHQSLTFRSFRELGVVPDNSGSKESNITGKRKQALKTNSGKKRKVT